MPKGIVYFFEVVNVYHYKTDRIIFAHGTREFTLQCFVQVAAVIQSRQRITDGLLAQFGLQTLDLIQLQLKLLVCLSKFLFAELIGGDVFFYSQIMGGNTADYL